MTDPLAIFADHVAGIYAKFALHLADDAVKLGWIPAPGRISTLCDRYVVWFRWLPCACGRGMPIPREAA